MCSSFEVACKLATLLTHGKKNTQGQQRSYSGLSRWAKALPKTGLFFKSIFAVKGKPQASEAWLPSPTPPFCQGMKSTFWKALLDCGSVRRDGSECLGGFCFCFPALHLPGISPLQRTLCPHRSYSWSSPDINPDSFCKDSWVKACPVFLFSPAIVFLCQHKWVYSCFIFKTPFYKSSVALWV